jgi:riboflavin transporter FmnP
MASFILRRKHMNKSTRPFITAGILISIGLILPIGFHAMGMGGPIFLPMHIPVLVGGAVLSPALALIIGILTPVLSSFITGMPVAYPILPIMAVELGLYGLCASLSMRKLKLNIWMTLALSMVVGRLGAGLTVYMLAQTLGLKMQALLYLKGAVITGLPGIAIQLVIIPLLVRALKRAGLNLNIQES